MADVAFSDSDYEGLPDELKGKSPQEIAAHYSRQSSSSQPSAHPTTADFMKDPAAATARVAVTREEMAAAHPTLVESAKLVAKSKHPDWDRFSAEIDAIMLKATPDMQRSSSMWETAYFNIKGQKADELTAEARASGAKGAEPPTASTPPAAPTISILVQNTGTDPANNSVKASRMLEGFGLNEEAYNKASRAIDEGKWPLTIDNIRRRTA